MVTRPQRRAEPHEVLVRQGATLVTRAPLVERAPTPELLAPEVPQRAAQEVVQPDRELEVWRLPRWKRGMDVVGATLALAVFAPLFALTGLLVRLDSPGPALFRQRRIGTGGREFECLKFRSMYVDAEERREAVAHLNEATGHVFKIRDDPRRTRVGKVLRKTSVDELPQFWNVLRGDMTLVGPRPPLPSEVALYEPHERARLRGVPGITGPWQVSAREHHDFQEMLALDVEYLENVSFLRDCRILLATIPAVLGARGSH